MFISVLFYCSITPMNRNYRETYLHQYAKVVLSSWLRKKIRIGPNTFKGLDNIPINVPKQQYPMFGVYTEYPVCSVKLSPNVIVGVNKSWEDWMKENTKSAESKTGVPSIKEIGTYKKLRLLYVFDVVIVANKTVKYVFEIKHKNPSSEDKIKFIADNKLIGYEISAQHIMEQVDLPKNVDLLHQWNIPSEQSLQNQSNGSDNNEQNVDDEIRDQEEDGSDQ